MFIDANVFIHAIETRDDKGKRSRAFIERVIIGQQKASTSMLVMNEVLFFFLRKDRQLALDAWKRLLSLPNLEILSLDPHSCRFVPDFLAEGLRPSDAFHASAMKSSGINAICSFDSDFDNLKGIRRQEPR